MMFDAIEPRNVWDNHRMYIYNLNTGIDYSKQKASEFTHLHGMRKVPS